VGLLDLTSCKLLHYSYVAIVIVLFKYSNSPYQKPDDYITKSVICTLNIDQYACPLIAKYLITDPHLQTGTSDNCNYLTHAPTLVNFKVTSTEFYCYAATCIQ